MLITSKVAGNPSNRVKSPSNSETSKWERSQQLVPSKGAGKLVLVLGAKWERLGVKILMVPRRLLGTNRAMGNLAAAGSKNFRFFVYLARRRREFLENLEAKAIDFL